MTKFSVVVPMYRTEKYLPDLLRSFEKQKGQGYSLEFIFVDDGSDDSCASLAQEFLTKGAHDGQVIRQENAGVSQARNVGIEVATGDWVTFPDSDDLLGTDYFSSAAQLLTRHDDLVLMSANVLRYMEGSGQRSDDHPLRYKFHGGRDCVDIATDFTYIQTQAASAFFRRDLLNKNKVRFISNLQVAEDAIFVSKYLLAAPAPVIGLLPNSHYLYRQRAASDSASDTYRDNPDFYFGRFERGYLPLLRKAVSGGYAPQWLQNLVIYDLNWLLAREMHADRKASHLSDEEKARVLDLLEQVLRYVDPSVIISYRITYMTPEVRAILLTLCGDALPTVGRVRLAKNVSGAFEFRYLFHEPMQERCLAGDKEIHPFAVKTRTLDYFGQKKLKERIIRLPETAGVSLELDGIKQNIQAGNYYFGMRQATSNGPTLHEQHGKSGGADPVPVWKQLAIRAAAEVVCWLRVSTKKQGIARMGNKLRRTRFISYVHNMALTPKYRKKYGQAWLFMDKVGAGGDSAEILYEYVRNNHPGVNAWFVIDKNSADWARLKKNGARLIAFRSWQHRIALQLATLVASSHLDQEIVQPVEHDYYRGRKRPWSFVYLQHGVLQHDLSHWFNTKDIDLFTAASVDEYNSIVADGSAYALTEDTVVLTGLPRHDAVLERASKQPPHERSIILVAPTWRNNMHFPRTAFGVQRQLRIPFLESNYGRQWMELLERPELRELATSQNAQIIFLPHPNLRGQLADVDFPEYVTVLENSPDVHALVARSRVLVTDYSSIFFEGALARARTVYFQFDQQEFLSGTHTYTKGYWDYDIHGFGPVTLTAADAAKSISSAFTSDDWPAEYEERLERTLPKADGQAAQRIFEEINGRIINGHGSRVKNLHFT